MRQKDCTDFINRTLAKHKVDAKFDSVDKLFRQATFGRYELPSRFGADTGYTEADLGVDSHSLIMLRDDFVNRGATAVTVGTRVFLSDRAFTRNDSYLNRDVADTPSIIVHELFHVARIDKRIVDSQQLTNEIREHCRKPGYSNPIILKH